MTPEDLKKKNVRTLRLILIVVGGMVALAYASAPLYNLFCKVTGFGGTTQRVAANTSAEVFEREITVRFVAETARNMPWRFKADQQAVTVRVGQDGFATFTAENPADTPVAGTAIFNVTPLKAGKYFNKTQCFCFGDQLLNPGQSTHFPVSFYIDPKIMQDRGMDDVKTITLSYTFFKQDTPELEKALETFYNAQD